MWVCAAEVTNHLKGERAMRRLFLGLILLGLLFSTVFAEENCYWKADRDLQRVYEHFEGISLEKAIDQLIVEKYGKPRQCGNVDVRFNGGGMRNHLFIGRNNTLEFMVSNDVALGGMSLGFEFTCTAGPVFEWVAGYGNITPEQSPVPNILLLHDSAFEGGIPWGTSANGRSCPDSILIGGTYLPGIFDPLPVHETEVVLYSMQFWLPYDTSLVGDTFFVDNVFYPPAGGWIFTELSSSESVVPDFQGIYNNSGNDPSAPAVEFTIKEPRCEFAGKSTDPNMVYPKKGELTFPEVPIDFDDFPGLRTERDGSKTIGVSIKFEGKDEDLIELGVQISAHRLKGYPIGASFPLNLLPKVCQEKGVKQINSMPIARDELNYSTDTINCKYSIIQDSLGLGGNSVIVGVIDRGIDWLHEDFIDSTGMTRIRFFWDQTDNNVPHPLTCHKNLP
jgi:hypothetical protein